MKYFNLDRLDVFSGGDGHKFELSFYGGFKIHSFGIIFFPGSEEQLFHFISFFKIYVYEFMYVYIYISMSVA